MYSQWHLIVGSCDCSSSKKEEEIKIIHFQRPETQKYSRQYTRINSYINFSHFNLLKYSCIYIYIYIFFFHHTTCESTCDTLSSSAANQGENTVSVAQYIQISLTLTFFSFPIFLDDFNLFLFSGNY